jgi:hypothetical protein
MIGIQGLNAESLVGYTLLSARFTVMLCSYRYDSDLHVAQVMDWIIREEAPKSFEGTITSIARRCAVVLSRTIYI